MKIIDDEMMDRFRKKTTCEWCHRYFRNGLDPHHLFARGMGGGGRLDVAINMCSLCRECHTDVHAGVIMRVDLLTRIAVREGKSQDEIIAEIHRLRRTPKGEKS